MPLFESFLDVKPVFGHAREHNAPRESGPGFLMQQFGWRRSTAMLLASALLGWAGAALADEQTGSEDLTVAAPKQGWADAQKGGGGGGATESKSNKK